MTTDSLALIANAHSALERARTLDEVKHIRDVAIAAEQYARAKKLGAEAERYAAEIVTRAERRMGEILVETPKETHPGPGRGKPSAVTEPGLPTPRQRAGKKLSARSQKLASIPEAEFETLLAEAKRPAPEVIAKQAAANQTRVRRQRSRDAVPLPDGAERRVGDARVVLADVADNSVSLVLTDPPYGDESRPLYDWLGEWAARVLVPGGSLICYTGQSRLDLDIAALGRDLRYWWLLSMQHTRAQRLAGKFVIAEFKPVLWYVKEFRRGRTLINDVLRPLTGPDKEHEWGQAEGGVTFLIENLTEPGELIVDPFAGSETWGKISANMGRRWIGADVAADFTSGVTA